VTSIFKYLTEEAHAVALIERGEIWLKPLAAFREMEDGGVRGDASDGKLQYAPGPILEITKESGEVVQLPGYRFTSAAKAEDIFVYCVSGSLTKELAAEFHSPFCVEIKDPVRLLSRIRSHVRLRSKLDQQIYHGAVEYRKLETVPVIDWALPERIAFMKSEDYARQDECRIVLGKKGAFAVENVDLQLEAGTASAATGKAHEPLVLKLGDLSRICELHRF